MLYREFMDHRCQRLRDNWCMKFPMKSFERLRKKSDEPESIHERADELREAWS